MLGELAIIGAGKVGTAIAVLAQRAGYTVTVGARSGSPFFEIVTPARAAGSAELVLLTVQDSAIEPLCREIAHQNGFRQGAVVAHCSGLLTSTILHSARERCECRVASVHPLQSFPTVEIALSTLPGSYWFWEGEEAAQGSIKTLVAKLGGQAQRIDASQKTLYHASAVVASNCIVALVDLAVSLATKAGIERKTALAALAPLASTAVRSAITIGPHEALTGPIVRGDLETVRQHLLALQPFKSEAIVYRTLLKEVLRMAREKQFLTHDVASNFEILLDGLLLRS